MVDILQSDTKSGMTFNDIDLRLVVRNVCELLRDLDMQQDEGLGICIARIINIITRL